MLTEIGGKGVEVFDCDKAVETLQESGKLSRDLVTAFGENALTPEGAVNKDLLRDIVRNNPEGRRKLDEIVHPKIAQMCLASTGTASPRISAAHWAGRRFP